MYWLRFVGRRWWWSKWHPLVRVGWFVTRNNDSGSQTVTYAGLGLIVAGLVFRSRKALHIYSTTIPAGQEIRFKVVKGNKTIAAG
ncbi:MAG: hypothetical protein ACR2N2_10870 [Acidimicrobiia bacterium]